MKLAPVVVATTAMQRAFEKGSGGLSSVDSESSTCSSCSAGDFSRISAPGSGTEAAGRALTSGVSGSGDMAGVAFELCIFLYQINHAPSHSSHLTDVLNPRLEHVQPETAVGEVGRGGGKCSNGRKTVWSPQSNAESVAKIGDGEIIFFYSFYGIISSGTVVTNLILWDPTLHALSVILGDQEAICGSGPNVAGIRCRKACGSRQHTARSP